MRYLQIKAHKVFKILVEWELARSILKYLTHNQFLPFWVRQYSLFSLSILPLASSYTFSKMRCFRSNQSRSVITFFKSNRVRVKFDFANLYLTGIKRSAW